jgi:hypothetical protein
MLLSPGTLLVDVNKRTFVEAHFQTRFEDNIKKCKCRGL